MTVWLVKLVHMAAIAVWLGGLVATPALLLQRTAVRDEVLERLHRASRFLHVAVSSPAGFVAVGSGTALIFLRETWVEWFSIKLVLVALLAGLHMAIGRGVVRTFEQGGRHGAPLAAVLITATLGLACAILWVVLAKPELDAARLAGGIVAPGGLEELLRPVADPVSDALTR